MRAAVRAEVDQATRLAEQAPGPGLDTLYDHLYG
jgi:TPP-dependent pyruvate/acetoin dehydrogenase alpha subunit